MKHQRYFPGIILIGFGGYFLLQHTNISFLQQFSGWPTLMMIVGLAMLWQGYGGKESEMIFPGVILFGFGLHFHVVTNLHIWPDHIGIFILIVALAYILKYQRTGVGLGYGIFFLILAAVLLFQDRLTGWLGTLESSTSFILNYWPILLIGFGLYFLLKKKR
ncbi:LiaF transmembrane domain-containing protein [Neobacillus sp. LXY-4]|uniref:LiaF transmembrane domain-containing protein n=1 Tax=Neobacillus sp. LXY-4 TaxID=3379826 RepID=UPI003EE19EA0